MPVSARVQSVGGAAAHAPDIPVPIDPGGHHEDLGALVAPFFELQEQLVCGALGAQVPRGFQRADRLPKLRQRRLLALLLAPQVLEALQGLLPAALLLKALTSRPKAPFQWAK